MQVGLQVAVVVYLQYLTVIKEIQFGEIMHRVERAFVH